MILGQHSFRLVADEEERSALVARPAAAREVHGLVAQAQGGEDVLVAALPSHVVDEEVGGLSDGALLGVHHEVAVVLQDGLAWLALLLHLTALLFYLLHSVGAADQRKDLFLVLPEVVHEDLHVVHVVHGHQCVSHMDLPLHLRVAIQAKSGELDHLRLLDVEPGQLGMIVGLDDGPFLVLDFLVVDEDRRVVSITLVVVVGDPEAILVGIFMFDDAEVLGVVEGNDFDGVAVAVVELVVDLRGRAGLQVDEVDGRVGSVEDDELLLAEHGELANHGGVIIAVDELSLGVDVDDGFRFAGPYNGSEDEGAVVGGGEGGDLAEGPLEVDISPVLEQHHLG